MRKKISKLFHDKEIEDLALSYANSMYPAPVDNPKQPLTRWQLKEGLLCVKVELEARLELQTLRQISMRKEIEQRNGRLRPELG